MLGEAALFLALLAAVRAYQTRDALRGAVPAQTLTSLDGRSFELGAPRDAPLLVYFWASWCGVCKAVEHNVAALAEDEVPLLTVASQSGDAAAVAGEVDARGLAYPVVADANGQLARSFGVRAFPTVFVVGRDGHVRSVEVGYTTELGLRLRMWWAGL